MERFAEEVARHLTKYKEKVLGISEEYVWRGKVYGHILSKKKWQYNFLEPIREDLITYLNNSRKIRNMHHKVHHMNSSQAMCLNLFFPLLRNEELFIFTELIGLKKFNVSRAEFEKTMSIDEGTNFDFFLEDEFGNKVFVETKYTENEFGKGNPKSHEIKRTTIYRDALCKIMDSEIVNSNFFYTYYQLFRNIYYLSNDIGNSHVCVVTTRRNKKIIEQYNHVANHVHDEFKHWLHLVYIEDIVEQAIFRCCEDTKITMRAFKEKYLNIVA